MPGRIFSVRSRKLVLDGIMFRNRKLFHDIQKIMFQVFESSNVKIGLLDISVHAFDNQEQ